MSVRKALASAADIGAEDSSSSSTGSISSTESESSEMESSESSEDTGDGESSRSATRQDSNSKTKEVNTSTQQQRPRRAPAVKRVVPIPTHTGVPQSRHRVYPVANHHPARKDDVPLTGSRYQYSYPYRYPYKENSLTPRAFPRAHMQYQQPKGEWNKVLSSNAGNEKALKNEPRGQQDQNVDISNHSNGHGNGNNSNGHSKHNNAEDLLHGTEKAPYDSTFDSPLAKHFRSVPP